MAVTRERGCPACHEVKSFRIDQKTCGCKKSLQERSEITADSWNISLPKTRIHTLDELVKFFEIDLAVWGIERFIANKWEIGAKDADDKLRIEPLFQVKAFLKRRKGIEAAHKEIDELKQLAKSVARIPAQVIKPIKITGNMLEINLTDHHFGKMAWGKETGHENYDTKIAAVVFNKAFQSLLQRTSGYEFDEIWFVIGNDLLNSDDAEGRTTFGTYVSTDQRYQKTFGVVRTLMVDAIEQLRPRTKLVKAIMVPGNHDRLSVWHLGDSLECYFHKYTDVVIDNEPKYRKYHRFGQVMIMFTHGDKGNKKAYPTLMATEQPKMFGETKFREAHTGNIHTLQVDEQFGVRVRTLSALCPPDAWHAERGFVGNLRSSEAFIWNKQEGLIGTVVYTDQGGQNNETNTGKY